MAGDRVETQIEKLKGLRALAPEAAAPEIRKALADKVNLVVAKAAQIAGEMRLTALLPDLMKAFERLFEKDKDPQCWGKNALAKALKDLGLQESALFLRGARHVQLEPVYGGREDSATVLRGACVMALVQCNDITRDDTLRCLVDALGETSDTVRLDAVQALEQMAGRDVVLLLRLKAHCGDKDVRVTGQVFEALLRLDGVDAVEFVGEFLGLGRSEVNEEAALALGASRLPEAVEVLLKAFKQWRVTGAGQVALRAISASRLDSALDFLLDLIRSGRGSEVEDALKALELHKRTEEIVARVKQAVEERGDDRLREVFRKEFGT